MSPVYGTTPDEFVDRARDEVTVARARVGEARRSLSGGRTSTAVEESAQAQARLQAAEVRLARMEWERELDLFTSRALVDGSLLDSRLVKLVHRVERGLPCPECLSAASLIRRGQKPPVGWTPSCGASLDYSESVSGESPPAA